MEGAGFLKFKLFCDKTFILIVTSTPALLMVVSYKKNKQKNNACVHSSEVGVALVEFLNSECLCIYNIQVSK